MDAGLFTLGIEEEFQLIDPETRDLRSHVQHLLDDEHTLADQLKPELHQSVIEVGTNICPDIPAARREVTDLRRDLAQLAKRNGLTIGAAMQLCLPIWAAAKAKYLERATLTLGATLRDPDGDAMPGVRVLWTSEDATIASVSQTGVVTGVRVGSVLVAASARGKDAFARLTITPAPVASVRLSAANHAMVIGDSVRLVAQTLDGAGNVLGRPVTWSTSNASVATVSNGVVTATGPGTATITATSEGKTGTAAITVAAVPVATVTVAPATLPLVVGQTGTLAATTRDAANNVLTGRDVTWSTSNANVATVSSAGVVTATGVGTATIMATPV